MSHVKPCVCMFANLILVILLCSALPKLDSIVTAVRVFKSKRFSR